MEKISALAPWPYYCDQQVRLVSDVLKSGKVNYWTGDQGKAFEREFADFHGMPHAIALANGTLALELALIVAGIGPGDEVIVTPRSYFASVSCVLLVGATPVFADVDSDTQNISAEAIATCISPRTKAVIPVHLAGWPCDMEGICSLADEHDFLVIEDCAQAHGARIGGKPVGSFGDFAAFSFCQDKIMTTGGEGGVLLVRNEEHWQAAWSYKDHGKSYAEVHRDDHPLGFRWLHTSVGTNWRMTELQCAIARWQLGKLDEWVDKRRNIAARYSEAFCGLDVVQTPEVPEVLTHAFYKYYMFVRPEKLADGWDRDRILLEFSKLGVPGLSGSCPEIYREKACKHLEQQSLPISKRLGETSIMLLTHPTLTDSNVTEVIDACTAVLRRASPVKT